MTNPRPPRETTANTTREDQAQSFELVAYVVTRPDGHGGADIDAAPLQIVVVESRTDREGKSEGQPKESQPK